MKASRLLHLLLLLQTRQRITTTELAERLEVSARTVLRDVEALSAAGVPVYAERGRHGGIALLPGARLDASRLEPRELEALSVAGLDGRQIERLGLAPAQTTATLKIAARQNALPKSANMARLADLIIVDNTAWLSESETETDIAGLASALGRKKRLRIRYRRSGQERARTRVVDPYGLVAKSGRWYLVADDEGAGRLFAVERLAAWEPLNTPATLRTGQTLRSVWAELQERTESPGPVNVAIRIRSSRLDLARRVLGSRLREVRDAEQGWGTAVVRYSDIESVRQLLQFGNHIEVLSPSAARERIRQLAEDLADRHSRPSRMSANRGEED